MDIVRSECPLCGAPKAPSNESNIPRFPGNREWADHYWHDCDGGDT